MGKETFLCRLQKRILSFFFLLPYYPRCSGQKCLEETHIVVTDPGNISQLQRSYQISIAFFTLSSGSLRFLHSLFYSQYLNINSLLFIIQKILGFKIQWRGSPISDSVKSFTKYFQYLYLQNKQLRTTPHFSEMSFMLFSFLCIKPLHELSTTCVSKIIPFF